MPFEDLLQHDVIISRKTEAAGDDAYGNKNYTWNDDAEPTAAFMQPDGQTEVLDPDGGDLIVADWRCGLSAETVITEGDRLKWEGFIFRVVGVKSFQGPGYTHHHTVSLRTVNVE